jgi:hypothetical protein
MIAFKHDKWKNQIGIYDFLSVLGALRTTLSLERAIYLFRKFHLLSVAFAIKSVLVVDEKIDK